MSNISYWRKRSEEIEDKIFKDNKKLINENIRIYKKAIEEINDRINKYIIEFADNNGKLSISKAKSLLNKKELEEFRLNVKEYIDLANKKNKGIIENTKLLNASLSHRIDRLEQLKYEMIMNINELSKTEIQLVNDRLKEVYDEVYYKTSYNIYNMTGKEKYISKLDHKTVNIALKEIWAGDGKHFSTRIWLNRQNLVNELFTRLSQGISLGYNAYDVINNLKDYLKNKDKNAQLNVARILQTEASVIRNKATFESYKESGLDKYQVVATLDGLTCDRCGEFDYKVYLVKDKEIGINSEPFHPMCRCSTVPYYDWLEETEERIARDGKGKTEQVPNMSYKEWYEKYVANNKNNVEKSIKKGIIETKRDYKVLSEKDIEIYQKQSDEVFSKLSKKEKEALEEYTLGGYININSDLADNSKNYYVDHINSAIKKYKLEEDITVYRGTRLEYYKDLKVGDTFKGKVFYSASVDKLQAQEFMKTQRDYGYESILLKINIPKGSNGLYIGNNTSYDVNEKEFLLSNKISYKVLDITENEIKLEAINENERINKKNIK